MRQNGERDVQEKCEVVACNMKHGGVVDCDVQQKCLMSLATCNKTFKSAAKCNSGEIERKEECTEEGSALC